MPYLTSNTSSGTISYGSNATATQYYFEVPPIETTDKIKSKESQRSDIGTALAKSEYIRGHISAITLKTSPLAKDAFIISFVSSNNIQMQIYDPTDPPYGESTKPIIGACDYSIVAYILEHITNTMDRANIIKTALLSLREEKSYPHVIIATYTRDCAEKMIKSKEKVQGIDQEELEMLAIYAGANSVWKSEHIEVEGMTCVAASFKKKPQHRNFMTLMSGRE